MLVIENLTKIYDNGFTALDFDPNNNPAIFK